LGVPETLREGEDVTLVTYGSCVRVGLEAVDQLSSVGISVELIDVQTLLPFDLNKTIVESIKKTGRVVFFDEDVPGGATAFMMQQVLEGQKAFYYLDEPAALQLLQVTIDLPLVTDGDYFSKPQCRRCI